MAVLDCHGKARHRSGPNQLLRNSAHGTGVSVNREGSPKLTVDSLIGMRVRFGLVGSGAQLIFRRGVILGVVLAPERAHLHVLLPDP